MAEAKEKSVFNTLYPVDISGKTEKKNGLTYLSWAWAWAEVKKRYPTAMYEYIKNDQGWNYHTDGRTAWVEVAIEIEGLRYEEHLPVMDYRNNSIPLDKITSFDVNKAQKRCLAKCLALHGLGLNLYIGEDMPDEDRNDQKNKGKDQNDSEKPQNGSKSSKKAEEVKQPIQELPSDYCTICRLPVTDFDGKTKSGDPVHYSKEDIISRSTTAFGAPVCMSCMMKKTAKTKQNKEVSNE